VWWMSDVDCMPSLLLLVAGQNLVVCWRDKGRTALMRAECLDLQLVLCVDVGSETEESQDGCLLDVSWMVVLVVFGTKERGL